MHAHAQPKVLFSLALSEGTLHKPQHAKYVWGSLRTGCQSERTRDRNVALLQRRFVVLIPDITDTKWSENIHTKERQFISNILIDLFLFL